MARLRNNSELAKWLILGAAGLLVLVVMLLVIFWAPSTEGTTARFYTAAGQTQCKPGITDTDMTTADVGDTEVQGSVKWTTAEAIGDIAANTPVQVSDYCLTDADAGVTDDTTITDRLVEIYCCSGSETGTDAGCFWKARVVDCTTEADACGTGAGVNADCKCQAGRCTASPAAST